MISLFQIHVDGSAQSAKAFKLVTKTNFQVLAAAKRKLQIRYPFKNENEQI